MPWLQSQEEKGKFVMTEAKKARIVYIKEHFLLLCKKDLVKALLLDRLVFYYQQNTEAHDLLEEEQGQGVKHTLDKSAKGWVKKSAAFLADSLLVGESDRTIQRKLDELFNLGYIQRKRDPGEAYWYQPNMSQIKKNLGNLGYDLEGNPVRGGEEGTDIPPDEHYSEERQKAEFARIPSAELKEATPEQKQEIKENQHWAGQFPALDNAPIEIRDISKVISEKTGFEPKRQGKDKDWVASVMAVWGATGRNKEILLEALEEGNKRRMDTQRPLTFSGPRSYIAYAKDIAARRALRASGQTPARIRVGQTNNGATTKREKIRFGMQSMAA